MNTLDSHSHNLLEACWNDTPASRFNNNTGTYHYDSLRCDVSTSGSYFRVDFTRNVSLSAGVQISITNINRLNSVSAVTAEETTYLTNEVNSMMGIPVDGTDCYNAGWTYLGNLAAAADSIQRYVNDAKAAGFEFKQLQYHAGYFMYGCKETKQFYDVNT